MHTTSEKLSKGRFARESKVAPATVQRRKELARAVANNDLLSPVASQRLSADEFDDVLQSIGINRFRTE